MSDVAQLIKEKLDIVDFLRQYLELKPAGKNFKASCPFHKEKTPSFMVSPDRQTWHCFGACSEGGDIIKFLMKYENLEFYDALKILAEKAGVEIQKFQNPDFKAHNLLYLITAAAKDFFKANLFKSETAKKYLKERGLKEDTVEEFELGLAPDEPDALSRHLTKLGYRISDIEKAGLVLKTERGTYWDRFRSRLIFPLYNHFGKAVGFTGRILPGQDDRNTGKYINSPETQIFTKSKFLYGFHKTKNDIRELKSAVLVEGQMDFLMMWQDGVQNTVATSGTALTGDHLKVLRRVADELVLSFDTDEAGQAAAERGIDLAGSLDFSIKLLMIKDTDFKDPADVIKDKPGFIKSLIESATPAMEYYFYKYYRKSAPELDKNLNIKKQNIRVILSKIKNLSSAVERSHWIKELSTLTNFEEKILLEEMENLKTEGVKVTAADLAEKTVEENFSRRDLICQRLIGSVLNRPEFKDLIEENLIYFPSYYRDIYEGKAEEGAEKIMGFISLRFSFEGEQENEAKFKKEIDSLLRELKIEYLKEKQREISLLISKLEREGDHGRLEEVLKEFDSISRQIHHLGV